VRFFILAVGGVIFGFVIGCGSAPKTEESPAAMKDIEAVISKRSLPKQESPREILVDYFGLHRSLGLERGKEHLGYAEKTFDTCNVGYGYSASNNCRRETFVSIHFQILCRDSEGTVSTAIAREDMKPLSGRSLNWIIQGARGVLRLDGEGFGQIKTTFRDSQRLQRLKLSIDNDFVYVRAGELRRIVTPRNWCN
jgi:hypothetical protein